MSRPWRWKSRWSLTVVKALAILGVQPGCGFCVQRGRVLSQIGGAAFNSTDGQQSNTSFPNAPSDSGPPQSSGSVSTAADIIRLVDVSIAASSSPDAYMGNPAAVSSSDDGGAVTAATGALSARGADPITLPQPPHLRWVVDVFDNTVHYLPHGVIDADLMQAMVNEVATQGSTPAGARLAGYGPSQQCPTGIQCAQDEGGLSVVLAGAVGDGQDWVFDLAVHPAWADAVRTGASSTLMVDHGTIVAAEVSASEAGLVYSGDFQRLRLHVHPTSSACDSDSGQTVCSMNMFVNTSVLATDFVPADNIWDVQLKVTLFERVMENSVSVTTRQSVMGQSQLTLVSFELDQALHPISCLLSGDVVQVEGPFRRAVAIFWPQANSILVLVQWDGTPGTSVGVSIKNDSLADGGGFLLQSPVTVDSYGLSVAFRGASAAAIPMMVISIAFLLLLVAGLGALGVSMWRVFLTKGAGPLVRVSECVLWEVATRVAAWTLLVFLLGQRIALYSSVTVCAPVGCVDSGFTLLHWTLFNVVTAVPDLDLPLWRSKFGTSGMIAPEEGAPLAAHLDILRASDPRFCNEGGCIASAHRLLGTADFRKMEDGVASVPLTVDEVHVQGFVLHADASENSADTLVTLETIDEILHSTSLPLGPEAAAPWRLAVAGVLIALGLVATVCALLHERLRERLLGDSGRAEPQARTIDARLGSTSWQLDGDAVLNGRGPVFGLVFALAPVATACGVSAASAGGGSFSLLGSIMVAVTLLGQLAVLCMWLLLGPALTSVKQLDALRAALKLGPDAKQLAPALSEKQPLSPPRSAPRTPAPTKKHNVVSYFPAATKLSSLKEESEPSSASVTPIRSTPSDQQKPAGPGAGGAGGANEHPSRPHSNTSIRGTWTGAGTDYDHNGNGGEGNGQRQAGADSLSNSRPNSRGSVSKTGQSGSCSMSTCIALDCERFFAPAGGQAVNVQVGTQGGGVVLDAAQLVWPRSALVVRVELGPKAKATEGLLAANLKFIELLRDKKLMPQPHALALRAANALAVKSGLLRTLETDLEVAEASLNALCTLLKRAAPSESPILRRLPPEQPAYSGISTLLDVLNTDAELIDQGLDILGDARVSEDGRPTTGTGSTDVHHERAPSTQHTGTMSVTEASPFPSGHMDVQYQQEVDLSITRSSVAPSEGLGRSVMPSAELQRAGSAQSKGSRTHRPPALPPHPMRSSDLATALQRSMTIPTAVGAPPMRSDGSRRSGANTTIPSQSVTMQSDMSRASSGQLSRSGALQTGGRQTLAQTLFESMRSNKTQEMEAEMSAMLDNVATSREVKMVSMSDPPGTPRCGLSDLTNVTTNVTNISDFAPSTATHTRDDSHSFFETALLNEAAFQQLRESKMRAASRHAAAAASPNVRSSRYTESRHGGEHAGEARGSSHRASETHAYTHSVYETLPGSPTVGDVTNATTFASAMSASPDCSPRSPAANRGSSSSRPPNPPGCGRVTNTSETVSTSTAPVSGRDSSMGQGQPRSDSSPLRGQGSVLELCGLGSIRSTPGTCQKSETSSRDLSFRQTPGIIGDSVYAGFFGSEDGPSSAQSTAAHSSMSNRRGARAMDIASRHSHSSQRANSADTAASQSHISWWSLDGVQHSGPRAGTPSSAPTGPETACATQSTIDYAQTTGPSDFRPHNEGISGTSPPDRGGLCISSDALASTSPRHEFGSRGLSDIMEETTHLTWLEDSEMLDAALGTAEEPGADLAPLRGGRGGRGGRGNAIESSVLLATDSSLSTVQTQCEPRGEGAAGSRGQFDMMHLGLEARQLLPKGDGQRLSAPASQTSVSTDTGRLGVPASTSPLRTSPCLSPSLRVPMVLMRRQSMSPEPRDGNASAPASAGSPHTAPRMERVHRRAGPVGEGYDLESIDLGQCTHSQPPMAGAGVYRARGQETELQPLNAWCVHSHMAAPVPTPARFAESEIQPAPARRDSDASGDCAPRYCLMLPPCGHGADVSAANGRPLGEARMTTPSARQARPGDHGGAGAWSAVDMNAAPSAPLSSRSSMSSLNGGLVAHTTIPEDDDMVTTEQLVATRRALAVEVGVDSTATMLLALLLPLTALPLGVRIYLATALLALRAFMLCLLRKPSLPFSQFIIISACVEVGVLAAAVVWHLVTAPEARMAYCTNHTCVGLQIALWAAALVMAALPLAASVRGLWSPPKVRAPTPRSGREMRGRNRFSRTSKGSLGLDRQPSSGELGASWAPSKARPAPRSEPSSTGVQPLLAAAMVTAPAAPGSASSSGRAATERLRRESSTGSREIRPTSPKGVGYVAARAVGSLTEIVKGSPKQQPQAVYNTQMPQKVHRQWAAAIPTSSWHFPGAAGGNMDGPSASRQSQLMQIPDM